MAGDRVPRPDSNLRPSEDRNSAYQEPDDRRRPGVMPMSTAQQRYLGLDAAAPRPALPPQHSAPARSQPASRHEGRSLPPTRRRPATAPMDFIMWESPVVDALPPPASAYASRARRERLRDNPNADVETPQEHVACTTPMIIDPPRHAQELVWAPPMVSTPSAPLYRTSEQPHPLRRRAASSVSDEPHFTHHGADGNGPHLSRQNQGEIIGPPPVTRQRAYTTSTAQRGLLRSPESLRPRAHSQAGISAPHRPPSFDGPATAIRDIAPRAGHPSPLSFVSQLSSDENSDFDTGSDVSDNTPPPTSAPPTATFSTTWQPTASYGSLPAPLGRTSPRSVSEASFEAESDDESEDEVDRADEGEYEALHAAWRTERIAASRVGPPTAAPPERRHLEGWFARVERRAQRAPRRVPEHPYLHSRSRPSPLPLGYAAAPHPVAIERGQLVHSHTAPRMYTSASSPWGMRVDPPRQAVHAQHTQSSPSTSAPALRAAFSWGGTSTAPTPAAAPASGYITYGPPPPPMMWSSSSSASHPTHGTAHDHHLQAMPLLGPQEMDSAFVPSTTIHSGTRPPDMPPPQLHGPPPQEAGPSASREKRKREKSAEDATSRMSREPVVPPDAEVVPKGRRKGGPVSRWSCDRCRTAKRRCEHSGGQHALPDFRSPCAFCRTRALPCTWSGERRRGRHQWLEVRRLETEATRLEVATAPDPPPQEPGAAAVGPTSSAGAAGAPSGSPSVGTSAASMDFQPTAANGDNTSRIGAASSSTIATGSAPLIE